MSKLHNLTLRMIHDVREDHWIGHCVELDLTTAGPDHWAVWQDLLNICKAQIQYAVDYGLTESLKRKETP